MSRKFVDFLNEVAGIMYVGGFLSHIIIGAAVGATDGGTATVIYEYKLISAYILILPGLAMKLMCDIALFTYWNERGRWMIVKLLCQAFLAVNAFVFLVPMMPKLLALAEAGDPSGPVSEAFHALEAKEALVGMSNVIPLVTEILMGAFKPRLGQRSNTAGLAA